MPNEENKSGEQKATEAEVESFRKDLGPFVVAAEMTRMAVVFTDVKERGNPIIFANDSFLCWAVTLRGVGCVDQPCEGLPLLRSVNDL